MTSPTTIPITPSVFMTRAVPTATQPRSTCQLPAGSRQEQQISSSAAVTAGMGLQPNQHFWGAAAAKP